MPDFFTLYLVLLLLNLSHCIIWGLIVFRYRDLRAARYWLGASALQVVAGILLSSQGETAHIVPTVGANGLVVLGFYLNMCGVRRLHGTDTERALVGSLVGLSCLLMLGTFDVWYGRNPLYTAVQALPLLLTGLYLLRYHRDELGAIVSSTAMIAGSLSHGVIAVGNTLILIGVAPAMNLRSAASIDLLVFLFAGVVWNFGFLLSAVDRLRGQVERLANEDELTGLANRRLFMRRLTEESVQTRTGEVFSVMVFDLDRFKLINDKYGHAAGDAALRHAVQVISAQLGSHDLFARLGGDEFALLLPQTELQEAEKVAERLVAELSKHPLGWSDLRIPVTASIGIAQFRAPSTRAEDLLEAADNALYQTKRRGRNGYSSASEVQKQPVLHALHLDTAMRAGKRASVAG